MTNASAIMIPEASALTVDTSCIDCSEVESQEDKDFLLEKGENILRIVARAALEVGRELVEIQERFREERKVGLEKFYGSIGICSSTASKWASKYRAFIAYTDIFGDEDRAQNVFENISAVTTQKIMSLPEEYREAFLADIACDNIPTSKQVIEAHNKPEVKLSKAEELLAKAKLRKQEADEKWEEVKADPDIDTQTAEYNRASAEPTAANKAIANFEQQIADLQAEIEKEKLNTAEEAEEKARVEKELQKLKFDDAAARAERVKRISSTLTLSVPQTLADVQRFFAERNEYPEETRKHLLEQCTMLANYIGDQL